MKNIINSLLILNAIAIACIFFGYQPSEPEKMDHKVDQKKEAKSDS